MSFTVEQLLAADATTIVNAANGLSANGPIYKVNLGPSCYGRECSRRRLGFNFESWG